MGKKTIILMIFSLLFLSTISSGISQTILITDENKSETIESNGYDMDAFEGYLLFAPMASKTTYLINNQGEIAHTWKSDYLPGYSVYLKENGNLIHTNYLGLHPFLPPHGGGVEEITPEGEIKWRYTHFNTTYMAHHDIEILPNGNILMLCQEYKDYNQVQKAGRQKSFLSPNKGMAFDYIIEVKPIGDDKGIIVWEWHVWDHLVQDIDPEKSNYGVISEHPELIDINFIDIDFYNSLIFEQLTHINAIDYNEEFDQIILSVGLFSEFWVIDHSTTTLGASGHSGGRSGMGGDILYRWGNPQTYNMGSEEDQVFFEVHDAQWIDDNLPGEGNILVFNNGYSRPEGSYSSIHEMTPPVDNKGHYQFDEGQVFGPEESTWVYTAKDKTDFYANHLSGCQRIENGNTIICSGPDGIFYEVTSDNELIWSYKNRFVVPPFNHVFKVRYYPPDHPGILQLLRPEEPPRPMGKIFSLTSKNITFSTQIDHYENNYIMFDWGDGSHSSWMNLTELDGNLSLTHSYTSSGIYFVKSKIRNQFGYESSWSKIFPVIVLGFSF